MTTHPLLEWLGFPRRERLHRDVFAYALAVAGTDCLTPLLGNIGPLLNNSLVVEGSPFGKKMDLYFETDTHCVAIEVKVRSGESLGQLRGYAAALTKYSTPKQRLLLFVSETGLIPEHMESWEDSFPQVHIRTITWDQLAAHLNVDDPIHWRTDVGLRQAQAHALTARMAGDSPETFTVQTDWHLHARALRDFALGVIERSGVEGLIHIHGPAAGAYGGKDQVLIDFARASWILPIDECEGIRSGNPFHDENTRLSVRIRFGIPPHGRLQLGVGAQLVPYPAGFKKKVRAELRYSEQQADAKIKSLCRHIGDTPSGYNSAWRMCKLLAEMPRSRTSRNPRFVGQRAAASATLIADCVPQVEEWLNGARNEDGPG